MWGQNTKTCTGSTTTAIHGQSVTVTDATGTEQGTATYQCGGGLWTKTASTCEPYCSSDTDCAAPKPYCNTSTNKCVECTSNSHCSVPTPNCNTSTNTCEACFTCAAGCTGWPPSASSVCQGNSVSQIRTCTNICGGYSCTISRTVSGSKDCNSCVSCCTSDSDCPHDPSAYTDSYCDTYYGGCSTCTWSPRPHSPSYGQCGRNQCLNRGKSWKSS